MSLEAGSRARTARVYDGSSIVAFVLGLGALACVPAFAPIAAVLGGGAVAAGLVSRRRLRLDPTLSGGRLSFLGFALGCVALFLTLSTLLLPAALLFLP